MNSGKRKLAALWLGASALTVPGVAQASPREDALELKLNALAAEVAQLREDLQAERAANAQLAAATQAATAEAAAAANQAGDARAKVAALETKPTAPAEGFRSGSTTIRLGGYLKMVAPPIRTSRTARSPPTRWAAISTCRRPSPRPWAGAASMTRTSAPSRPGCGSTSIRRSPATWSRATSKAISR